MALESVVHQDFGVTQRLQVTRSRLARGDLNQMSCMHFKPFGEEGDKKKTKQNKTTKTKG